MRSWSVGMYYLGILLEGRWKPTEVSIVITGNPVGIQTAYI
jgi:hypothetical protein